MTKETIGHIPDNITGIPEVRKNLIEVRFAPKLNRADSILNQASDSQLDFFAQILS